MLTGVSMWHTIILKWYEVGNSGGFHGFLRITLDFIDRLVESTPSLVLSLGALRAVHLSSRAPNQHSILNFSARISLEPGN
jgi:hypothetical protein